MKVSGIQNNTALDPTYYGQKKWDDDRNVIFGEKV